MNEANPAISLLTCPHCGNEEATVHRQKKGGTLYYRCQSVGYCGTVQIRGPGGQRFIEQNRRDLGSNPEPAPAAGPLPEPEHPEPEPVPAPPTEPEKTLKGKKRGLLDFLLEE